MDLKYLDKLSKLCQKHGIRHVKTAEFELSFDHVPAPLTTDPVSEAPLTDYNPDDLIDWSSSVAS